MMQISRRHFNHGLALSLGSLPLFRRFPLQKQLRVNGHRIMEHIFALAEFGKNPQGGASRVAYSEADREGRGFVHGLMKDARLDITIDAAGNSFGVLNRTAKRKFDLGSSRQIQFGVSIKF